MIEIDWRDASFFFSGWIIGVLYVWLVIPWLKNK